MGCIPRRTRSGVDTDRIGVNVLSVFKAFSQFSSLVCFQGQLRGGSDVNMRTTRTPSDLWLNWQVRTDRDRTRSEDSRRKWKTDTFCACFLFVSKPKRELCNMSLKHHRFSCRGKKVLFRCGEARAFFSLRVFPENWTFSAKINHPYYLNKLLLVHFLKRGNTAQSKGV